MKNDNAVKLQKVNKRHPKRMSNQSQQHRTGVEKGLLVLGEERDDLLGRHDVLQKERTLLQTANNLSNQLDRSLQIVNQKITSSLKSPYLIVGSINFGF
jgi:hypothetical protein